MADGKLGIDQKITFLDHIKDQSPLYLGFLETEADFTENYGELDISTEIIPVNVAAKFNSVSTNVSGTLCRIANDAAIVTGNAVAGGVTLTGWFLATTNAPTTADVIALQNFATAVTTILGVPLAFDTGNLKVELD
jgi:hypothetical protein